MSNPHDQVSRFYSQLFNFPEGYDEELVGSIDSLLGHSPSQILDCGCGVGNPSIGLAKLGHTVTGIDSSPGMLQIALERAKKAGVEIELLLVEMQEIKTFPRQFDMAIFHDCLYDFKEKDEFIIFLCSVRKRVRLGGIIYIATKRWDYKNNKEDRKRLEFRGSVSGDNELIVFDICDSDKLKVFLVADDVEGARTERIVFPWHPWSPKAIQSMVAKAGFVWPLDADSSVEAKYGCLNIVGVFLPSWYGSNGFL